MMKASELPSLCAKSLKSIIKIALQSRRVTSPNKCDKPGNAIVVLGNGPSLKDTIASSSEKIKSMPSLAVNFMANTPQFRELKPDYYVLADPLFFTFTNQENFQKLWQELGTVDWHITLCVPAKWSRRATQLLPRDNKNITISTFNFIGVEGFAWLERFAYRTGIGMPRPRNVLIPSIMCAIAAGYKTIYVAGADHSWLETLRVTDDNTLVSVQPHFYTDSKTELKRSESQYKGIRLHQILYSFYVAFSSYHTLRRFADSINVKIFNITPVSYIDAFERSIF